MGRLVHQRAGPVRFLAADGLPDDDLVPGRALQSAGRRRVRVARSAREVRLDGEWHRSLAVPLRRTPILEDDIQLERHASGSASAATASRSPARSSSIADHPDRGARALARAVRSELHRSSALARAPLAAGRSAGHISRHRRDRPRSALAPDLRRADLADGRVLRRLDGTGRSAPCSAPSPATTAAGRLRRSCASPTSFFSIPLLPLLLVLTAIVAASSNKAALEFRRDRADHRRLSWPPVARLVRASFLSLREKEFAEAARARRQPRRADHLPAPACPTRSRRSSCRRRSTSPASSSSNRPSRSWASASSRRPRRGATCWPTPSPTWRSPRGSAIFPGLCILDDGARHQLSRRRPAGRPRPEHEVVPARPSVGSRRLCRTHRCATIRSPRVREWRNW